MRTKSKYFTYTATHHSLQVHLRAPIIVIQNHNICCGQIDPRNSCPGAQHENKLSLPGMLYMLIVSPHVGSIHPDRSTQILSTYSNLKDVQHFGHLRENQNPGTFLLKPHKQGLKSQSISLFI